VQLQAALERFFDIPTFAYAVALYTFQFLRPHARQMLVYKIAEATEPGGN
jgi:hypothetical protein